MSEWDWLLNVTCNDISVIYVTAHRCTGGLKKKFDLRSGSQSHRHFVGFFNVPVQAPTRGQPFYGYSEKPPQFSRLLRHARGYGIHIVSLTTGSRWGQNWKLDIYMYILKLTLCDIIQVCIFIKVVLIPFWFPTVNIGPPDLYQISKNNDTIISKMEVLGINKESLNILAEMLKSFWTSRSKSRIWKIMPVQILIYAVIFWILCQSEWNYASQNRLTCHFQHHCSRYFFILKEITFQTF